MDDRTKTPETDNELTNEYVNEDEYSCLVPELTPPTPSPSGSSASYIDKLSMELLLNKTQYQKYLVKTDPQKYAEYQEFVENCHRLRRPIVDITARLLDNPKRNTYSEDVSEAFQKYAQILIRYLDIKEMTEQAEDLDGSDEDMMFPASMNG
jgi:hypothetical protein